MNAAQSLAAIRIARSPLRFKHDRRTIEKTKGSSSISTLLRGAVLAQWRFPDAPEAPSKHVALKLMQDMLWRAGKTR
jgi:hypothetical protein